MIKIKEYGVYDLKEDEQCIYIGTMTEVSRFLNYSKDTLWSYLSRKKHDRSLLINHRYEIVEVIEEEQQEEKRKTDQEVFEELIKSFTGQRSITTLKEEISKFKIFDEVKWIVKGLADKVIIEEEWKKIPQFDYSISNYGRIRNDKNGKLKSLRYHRWMIQVDIYKDGKRYTIDVPRLEAMLFIRKVERNERVSYIDGDRRNLYYKNLKIIERGVKNEL